MVKKRKECICEPVDWVGRISSHVDLAAADGPMHSEWICGLQSHRDAAEAEVRALGFEPIFIAAKVKT